MSRKILKYRQVRQKLQWYFEQINILELQSMNLGMEVSGSSIEKRQWIKVERRLEVIKIKTVLETLAQKGGMPYQGRALRLTPRMSRHIEMEFTNKNEALAVLYGVTKDKKRKKRNRDVYCQTLNIALARIEAALYLTGVLQKKN